MTVKDIFKAELDRLKDETSIGLSEWENGVEHGRMEVINALYKALDSMQEEPVNDDLEDEITRYCNPMLGRICDAWNKQQPVELNLGVVARHFADWQKQQMLKDAVDAEISFRFHRLSIDLKDNGIEGFECGDKVKIIIIKRTDQ